MTEKPAKLTLTSEEKVKIVPEVAATLQWRHLHFRFVQAKMDADLTDDELRSELVRFGQNVGPITATTRKVWIKRLLSLRSDAKKAAHKAAKAKKLVGLSSDESQQSDEEAGAISNSQKSTSGTPRGRSGKLSMSRSNTEPVRESRKSARSSTSTFKPIVNSNDNDRTLPKKLKTSKSLQNNRSTRSQIPTIHLAEYSEDDGTSSVDDQADYDEGLLDGHSLRFKPIIDSSSSRGNRQSTIPNYLKSTVSGRRSLSDIRRSYLHDGNDLNNSLTSPQQSMLSMGINTTPSLMDSMNMDTSMGFSHSLDDSLTPPPASTSSDKSDHETNKKDSQGDGYNTHGFKTNEDVEAYNYPHYISWGLVLSVVAIFIGIASIYLVNVVMHSRESAAHTQKGQKALSGNLTSTERCIYSVLDYLSTVSGEAVCRSLHGGGQVSTKDVRVNAQGSSNQDTWVRCLDKLIAKPAWGIRLYTQEGMFAEKANEVEYMESIYPNMPFSCRLRRSFQKLLILTAGIVAVLLCVAAVVYVVKYFRKRKDDARRQFYDLVEEIMDTLQQHASACKQNTELKPYLAIPHVRDMLIPPGERRSKKKLWDTAVGFLEANESRVRTESQVIMGEEFLVWRWLPSTCEPTTTPTSGGRVWQGQAFADPKSTKPHYSPTACLKVRNMFDACVEFGEEWPYTIQDAILEKCVQSCPRAIHHIAVDKTSKEGCVYIKCESKEAAGQVYKALHGWWFDGKLVTVKYLRAERYLERFPESASYNTALSPSSQQMLSMGGAS